MKRSSILDNLSFNSYAVEEENENRTYYKIKMMMLGAKSVGKSSLIEVYTHEKKPDYQKQKAEHISKGTQGLDFVSKVQTIEDVEYKLHIWDTADFKFNSNIPPSLYDGVLGFIIVYNITRKQTFDLVSTIYNEISSKGDPNKVIFLVGTHAEIATQPGMRQVNLEEVQKYAAIRKIRVKEISIKSHDEVQNLFKEITRCIIDKKPYGNSTIKLSNPVGSDGFQKRYNKCC